VGIVSWKFGGRGRAFGGYWRRGHLQGALVLLLLQSTRQRLVRQVGGQAGGGAAGRRADPLALQQNDANADDYHR